MVNLKMKAFTTCLLLAAPLGIVFAVLFAQQNQTTQKPNPEIETLKNRISELENKLQKTRNPNEPKPTRHPNPTRPTTYLV